MELSARKRQILRAIVEDYINTARPVGSKSVAKLSGLDVSTATIRIEMGELTRAGYLEQPHTSAGRIPAPLAYRFYMNELIAEQRLSVQDTKQINDALRERLAQLDTMVAELTGMISELSNHPVYTLLRSRAYLAGAAQVLESTDYSEIEKARQLLAFIDDSPKLPLPRKDVITDE
jgi:heat-inducible transcriptional repressor